ncbi:MAG TPA: WhiB family transcriptional regulator [Pseudonocardiaceae bacterium]
MTSVDDEQWLIEIAWRLDRQRWTPTELLTEVAMRDGACVQAYQAQEIPPWTGRDLTDRQLAAQLCRRCPVQDECLELEMRTAGESTVGVWGALNEDDRRALYPHWLRRGERATDQVDGPDGEVRP